MSTEIQKLTSFLLPINHPQFKGLVKLNLVKRESFDLDICLIKLKLINDIKVQESTIEIVMKKCDEDPSNEEYILRTLQYDMSGVISFNYSQIEDFINYLDSIVITENNKDNIPIMITNKNNRLRFVLNFKMFNRMKRFINGLLNNYSLIESLVKINNKNNENAAEIKKENINNQQVINNTVEQINNNSEEIIQHEQTTSELILSYVQLSPCLINQLIHNILSKYIYYNDSEFTNNQLIGYNPITFGVNYNNNYYNALIKALPEIKNETVLFIVNGFYKLLSQKDNLKPVHYESILNILLFLSIRHYLTNPYTSEWLIQNFNEIMISSDKQNKLINGYLKEIKRINNINFFNIEIRPNLNLDNFEDDPELNSEVEYLSDKYDYLKDFSQEDFLSEMLNDKSFNMTNNTLLTNNNLNEFKFTKTIQLDIRSLIRKDDQTNITNNPLVNLPNVKNIYSNYLLNYSLNKKNQRIISEPYYWFNKYLENPLNIKNVPSNLISNQIIKSFEKIKLLLSSNEIKNENNSTLSYYKILTKYFPDNTLTYEQLLFIVFQIIVPYMYHMNDIKLFEDNFIMYF